MVKPVSLTVHKNNRDQRARKQVRQRLINDAKAIGGSAINEGFFRVSSGSIPSRAMCKARQSG